MCLEFTRLSQLSGDAKYYDAADRVTRFLERIQYETKLPGMWPKTLDFKTEKAPGNRFSLGAQADVLYEYLPKMHQLLGGLDDTYEKLYKGAAKPIMDNLLFRPVLPNEDDILFAGDFIIHHRGTELVPESQHISCFAGGMFGLGGKLFGEQSHINTGERLARGCGWAFEQFPTGVMPEIFGLLPCDRNEECSWDEDRWQRQGDKSLSRGWIHARDPRYLLRPDAIESIFIMYRLTGKESWRQLAWEMFEGIIWSTETEFAHSAISDVKAKGDTEKIDSMEVNSIPHAFTHK
jgi:mannosyl-oligosaccharide alpha-1,2-mannosidase